MAGLILPGDEANTLNAVLSQTLNLILYTSNTTPSKSGYGSNTSDFTEAAGGGYAAKSFNSASWTLTGSNPTVATYAKQTFAFTGALTGGASIYGYAIKTASGTIIAAELASAPFTPSTTSNAYSVTPTINFK